MITDIVDVQPFSSAVTIVNVLPAQPGSQGQSHDSGGTIAVKGNGLSDTGLIQIGGIGTF